MLWIKEQLLPHCLNYYGNAQPATLFETPSLTAEKVTAAREVEEQKREGEVLAKKSLGNKEGSKGCKWWGKIFGFKGSDARYSWSAVKIWSWLWWGLLAGCCYGLPIRDYWQTVHKICERFANLFLLADSWCSEQKSNYYRSIQKISATR